MTPTEGLITSGLLLLRRRRSRSRSAGGAAKDRPPARAGEARPRGAMAGRSPAPLPPRHAPATRRPRGSRRSSHDQGKASRLRERHAAAARRDANRQARASLVVSLPGSCGPSPRGRGEWDAHAPRPAHGSDRAPALPPRLAPDATTSRPCRHSLHGQVRAVRYRRPGASAFRAASPGRRQKLNVPFRKRYLRGKWRRRDRTRARSPRLAIA
jgi:hypothetical protein